uniref:Odorant binding protein 13 n=1 Tax=Colaphellus bowringi TaxID=561076 RepID=A0A0S3J2M2_9CUCU|nr:odorant binding protein 13 [Colaphellus bowringi]
MKFLVAFILTVAVCFVQAGVTEEQKKKIESYHKECSKQTGIDEDLVNKARNGQYTDTQILKDYLFCTSKLAGFINDNNELQKDVILQKTSVSTKDSAAAQKMFEACAVPQKNGPETSYHVLKCYYEKSGLSLV